MTKLHPLFEQALAPFLKPVATRNGPVDGFYLCGCEKQLAQQDPPVVRATCRIHRAVAKQLAASYPYPHCRQKAVCAGKGNCPLDPSCGD